MKKALIIGLLFVLCANIFTQTNKDWQLFPRDTKFFWDITSPVFTATGDTTMHLEIATIHEVTNIEFKLQWILAEGDTICISEKEILYSSSSRRINDVPDVFVEEKIWYSLYILPGPRVSPWNVKGVRLSGKFFTGNSWKQMGPSLTLCHNGRK